VPRIDLTSLAAKVLLPSQGGHVSLPLRISFPPFATAGRALLFLDKKVTKKSRL